MAGTPLLGIPLPVSSGTDQVPTDMATALDVVEKAVVMTFATASARTSAFTAASITPVAGMLSWLTSPGRYEQYSGSAWIPLIGHLALPIGTSALVGTNWDGVSTTFTYQGSAVCTVGGSAIFNFTLANPFSNGLLQVLIAPGDNASALGFVVPVISGCTLSNIQGGAFTQSAAAVGSGNSIRVSYVVTGW